MLLLNENPVYQQRVATLGVKNQKCVVRTCACVGVGSLTCVVLKRSFFISRTVNIVKIISIFQVSQ